MRQHGLHFFPSKELVNEHIRHYALSQRNHLMAEKTARRLGSMIQLLRHPADSLEVMQGNQGIYHLLFHEIK